MIKQNIKLTTDMVVFCVIDEKLMVLLVQRKHDPYKGQWALPGGFVEDDEDLVDGAKRELEEETGLKIKNAKQLHTYGTPGRDPRGRTVSVAYFALIEQKDSKVKAGDDAAEAQWHNVHRLPELAFDHAEILQDALKALDGEAGV
jgi:8-oxo-dGTP diphosphatase